MTISEENAATLTHYYPNDIHIKISDSYLKFILKIYSVR